MPQHRILKTHLYNLFILPVKCYLLLLLPLSLYGQVKVAGEMRKIMQQADLSASIMLDTLNSDHLYGLGVAEGLKGEIIVLDGQSFVTTSGTDDLQTGTGTSVKAAMFVYETIDSWRLADQKPVQSLQDLERHLESLIQQQGKSFNHPFAFLIKVKSGKINYHVIDWQPGTDHNMSNHRQFAKNGEITDDAATILGFYSDRHQGVFTHHDSKLHLHVLAGDSKIVGHVDKLYLQEYELFLPDQR